MEEAQQNAWKSDKMVPDEGKVEVYAIRAQGKPKWSLTQDSRGQQGSSTRGKYEYSRKSSEDKDTRTCYCCGKPNHWARDCRHNKSTCRNCGRRGHLTTVCRGAQQTKKQVKYMEEDEEGQRSLSDPEDDVWYMTEVKTMKATEEDCKPIFLEVKINNKSIEMEIDIDTYKSIISEENLESLKLKKECTKLGLKLQAYEQLPLNVKGELKGLEVEYKGKKRN